MGTDRIVYIRTDGNSQIASGHLIRCFSVAQACKKLGMNVRFLVSDEESASLLSGILRESGTLDLPEDEFQILQLKTAAYNNLEQELPEVASLLSRHPDTSSQRSVASFTSNDVPSLSDTYVANRNIIYFIDSYYVTEKYLTALRPFTKVVYLDDLQLFDYPADLLINYDVIPDSAITSYKAAYQNAGQLLLGALYTPLRSQFQNRKITVKEQVSDILITTGGSDPYHFCLKLIHSLCNSVSENSYTDHNMAKNQDTAEESLKSAMFSGTNLHIVIGKLNADRDALYRLTDKYPFLQLHENVSDMASLMEHCDLAVSASGTTLYELCALGIPAISFTMADNQLISANAFESAGAIPYAGDIRTEEKKVLRAVINFMTQMSSLSSSQTGQSENNDSILAPVAHSYKTRKSAHDTMRRLVDGNGAMRIAEAIMQL